MNKEKQSEKLSQIIENIINIFDENNNTEDLYSIFDIPKSNGKKRIICAPREQLKNIQRDINKYILYPYYKDNFTSNRIIHGFAPNKSILTNAASHSKNVRELSGLRLIILQKENIITRASDVCSMTSSKLTREGFLPLSYHTIPAISNIPNIAPCEKSKGVIFKADIKDFFYSIKSNAVKDIFRKAIVSISISNKYTYKEIATLLTKACTFYGSLPQGAPTSPWLANMAMSNADLEIEKKLTKFNRNLFFREEDTTNIIGFKATYTRYADDIAISFCMITNNNIYPKISKGRVAAEINRILAKNKMYLNKKKTRLLTKKHGFKLTGVTLGGAAPTISRRRYNEIRAAINNYVCDFITNGETEFNSKEFNKLSGDIRFVAGLDYVKASALYNYFLKRAHSFCYNSNLKQTYKEKRDSDELLVTKIKTLRKVGNRVLDSDLFERCRTFRRLVYSGHIEKSNLLKAIQASEETEE